MTTLDQIRIVTANEGGSSEVPLADGAGGYEWGPQGGEGGIQGWLADTEYDQGQQVSFDGQLYAALTAFTSGSTFAGDSENWLALGALDGRYAQQQSDSAFNIAIGTGAGGLVGAGGGRNTAIGFNALAAGTTANNCTAIGINTLTNATTATGCTAMGSAALFKNQTGRLCTAIGDASLQNSLGDQNTALGENSGITVTTGQNNTLIGWQAGGNLAGGAASPTWDGTGAFTGSNNTAIGANAMLVNTSGGGNVAAGFNAMLANTTGSFNAAFGNGSLIANTTGGDNLAIGASALAANTTQTGNVAVGFKALFVATATANTAVGQNALAASTTGSNNTAIGSSAGGANTTGQSNTSIGQQAGFGNTTGSQNTAVGAATLAATSTGGSNTAVGYNALNSNTGGNNTAIGVSALSNNVAGLDNTGVGFQTGLGIVSGDFNAFLGYNTGNTDGTTATTDVTSATLIGERAQTTLSNAIVLGKAITPRPNLFFGAVPSTALMSDATAAHLGVGTFFMATAVTNPGAGASKPVGGVLLYPDSATGTLKVLDTNGTVTPLSNMSNGTTTLVGGTKAIANTSITAASIVKAHNYSGAGTVGALSITLNAGTGFTINSTSGSDTSKVYYEVVSY